ncbi:hypothetical protein MSAN_02287500 [Mycena sanguinolenta]|uniref:Uncharacterized protein n=1 Tax=Mycena sanguinolenta TaxID=230812 RepID=A0A8H7CIF5_9AGAR|nr:hypothetical protein MSAN_02287500 [Mycena sanguinolenta]
MGKKREKPLEVQMDDNAYSLRRPENNSAGSIMPEMLRGFVKRVGPRWQKNGPQILGLYTTYMLTSMTGRMAIKAKRRRSDKQQPSKLTTAELAASQTLAEMLKNKATTISDHISSSAGADISSKDEATIDREIANLVEQVKYDKVSSEDEDNDVDNGAFTMIGADVFTDRTEHVIQCKSPSRRRSLKWRLPAPMANSPSPEPEGRLPSLYDKLFQ